VTFRALSAGASDTGASDTGASDTGASAAGMPMLRSQCPGTLPTRPVRRTAGYVVLVTNRNPEVDAWFEADDLAAMAG